MMTPRLIIAATAVICTIFLAHAQLLETFDSNSWQWTEYSGPEGDAIIIDGVMRLESKKGVKNEDDFTDISDQVVTHAYVGIDPSKGFTMRCEAKVKKIDDKKLFGIVLNYIDDMNCMLFMVRENMAILYTIRDGKIVGVNKNQFKLNKQKKANLEFEVRYYGSELEFRINDMQALKRRYAEIVSNGIGFFAFGKAQVDFDNVELSD